MSRPGHCGCGRLWRTRKAKDICSNITWDAIKPVSTSQLITTMAIPSYNNKVMWLGTIGGSPAFPRRGRELWMTTKLQSLVNLSSNAGNWTEMSGGSGLPDRPVSRVALHPTDPALVYVAFSGWSDSGSHNLWQGVRQTRLISSTLVGTRRRTSRLRARCLRAQKANVLRVMLTSSLRSWAGPAALT